MSIEKEIRVMHVGADNKPGGVAFYINNIVDNISGSEIEFHATVPFLKNKNFLSSSIKIHGLCIEYNIINIVKKIITLRNLLNNEKIDIVHLHTARAGLIGTFACIGLGIKVIYSGHSWRHEQKNFFYLKYIFKKMEKFISMRAHYVTFLTSRDRIYGVKNGLVKSKNSRAINTRLDLNISGQPTKSDFSTSTQFDAAPLILNVGELSDRKNPLLFVEIASRVISLRNDVKFEWIGDGYLRNQVSKRIADLGLVDKINLLGHCDREKVEDKLKKCHILLFTSRYEGVPLSIIEAKLAGVPVVSTAYPNAGEIIRDGKDGFIFNESNPDVAANKLIELLTDLDLYHRFSAASYKYAKVHHVNSKIMANEFKKIYTTLLNATH